MNYQTMTFDEQSEILDNLDKARRVINNKPDNQANQETHSIIIAIDAVFHRVQNANTQEL